MPQPKDLDPAESPRSFYGSELRRLREAAGLTQERLGELVFSSGAYIGHLEAASRRPQLDMSEQLDQVLETGGYFARLYPMVTRSRYPEYFVHVVELQTRAQSISSYCPALIQGLLQTPDYARAVFESAQPLRSVEETEVLVAARMARADILDGPTAPVLWTVLDEAIIRRPIGSAATMRDQLAHLVRLVRSRRLIVQVLPFSAGAHALLEGMALHMTFEDEPPMVYLEGPHIGRLVDDPLLVARCLRSYDLVRAAALSPEVSLTLLESAMEDYSREQL
ncbi:Scr1 family TA system antitoxin-like transcriptional regulator [Kitasatospora sp. NBC_00315]|uniref:helix-turn-helix domain-containing protein n=1 Tax=Kitasatospora sp. NBC_00315 TaxID=2975963 RepID=UPI00325395E4